jgi:hypothetical protein
MSTSIINLYEIGDIIVLHGYRKRVAIVVGFERLFGSVLYHIIICGEEKVRIHYVYEANIQGKL